ncbi:hypothetical protein BGW80DRAFT_1408985 [Lactifluus volemus]|nr:hypothetical protein BGW80DRAFT_1408985 [Lactifluus volemus]
MPVLPCVPRQLSGDAECDTDECEEHGIDKIPTQDIICERERKQRCSGRGPDCALESNHAWSGRGRSLSQANACSALLPVEEPFGRVGAVMATADVARRQILEREQEHGVDDQVCSHTDKLDKGHRRHFEQCAARNNLEFKLPVRCQVLFVVCSQ